MDKEVAETMAYFRENISELKRLGKEWGLSDTEIEECVDRAMSIDPKDLPSKASETSTTRMKFAARKSWPKFRVLMWIVGVMIALVGMGALALQNDYIEHRFSQIVQPVIYPVFRTLRLATIKLHDTFDLYDQFGEDCVINNPLFSRESMLGDHACENCNTVKTVTQFTESSLEQGPPPGTAFMEPILFKGKGQNMSLAIFQSILSSNPFVPLPMQGFKTNLTWASHIKDLLAEDAAQKLAAKPDFFFFWKSKLVWTSQIMRKAFPRPDMLGKGSEVAITKSIFITGPSADTVMLPVSPIGSFSWYAQGTGSRQLMLTPTNMCSDECIPITVPLTPGDIATYNCEMYTGQVEGDGDDISIGFLAHFTPKDF